MKLIYLKQIAAISMLWLATITASAQNQKLTLDFKDTPVKSVLESLEKQLDKPFFYEEGLINLNNRVNISVKNADLNTVINTLFSGKITASVVEGHIVLKKTPVPANAAGNTTGNDDVAAQTQTNIPQTTKTTAATQNTLTVRGTVLDEEGNPLPGAVVMLKGNNRINATTDSDGKFTLAGVPSNETLLISFLGYESREEIVNGRTALSLTLKPSTKLLDEVVVTGYQTLSKERTTGSFSIITSEKLDNKLQPALRSILEGQSAGLVVTKDGKVEIRGVSTFTGVKDPLIVLDGYPLIGDGATLDNINPENIQSITVLKDAVAASIYGARASNGVIVVTTKSASTAKGTINFGYRGTYGVTMKPDLSKLNFANVNDYMDVELEIYNQSPNSYYNRYNSYGKLSDYTYLLMAKVRSLMPATEADSKIEALRNNNALQQLQDNIFRASQSQQHNVNISSGSDKNQFSAAFRYLGESGNMLYQKNSRLTADVNDTWDPFKWLSLRVLSNINYTTSKSPVDSYMELTDFTSPTRAKILPYSQLYDEVGNQTPWQPVGQRRIGTYEARSGMKSVFYHPAEDLNQAYNTGSNLQVRLGGDINIKFFDFLKGSFGGTWTKGAVMNRTIYEGNSFAMRAAYNDGTAANPADSRQHYIPEGGRIDESRGTMESWVIRTQLNYNQSFKNTLHRVSAMLGSEISDDTYESSYLPTRLGYDHVSASYNSGFDPYEYNKNTDNIKSNMLFGGAPSTLPTTISYGNNYSVRDNRFVSWYGNASYEYNNKYVINGSIRLDLTNFFGTAPEFRYKPTWSVGGKYKMAEEGFFSGLRNIFNQFDIRVSYGVTGNISPENTPFLILKIDSDSGTVPIMGGISYDISSYPNSTLRWEKTNIVDFGIDFSMFNNRLSLTAEYYNKKSTDLISSDAIDPTKGVSKVNQNVGAITNSGFEITLNGSIIQSKSFTWNSSLLIGYNHSNIDYYSGSLTSFASYIMPSVLKEGYPIDGVWGAKFAGIDNTGEPLFYNSEGAKIAAYSLEAKDAIYLGLLNPPLNISWTNSFRYQNLEASFMLIGKFGNKFREDCFDGTNYKNRHVGERWKKAGDEENTIYPKYGNFGSMYYSYGDMLIGNANFVKLRDFTLGYYLPKKWINPIGLSSVKAYFQTRNLFCITAKGVDIDPEISQVSYTSGGTTYLQNFTSLPLRPEFYFGIMINL